MTDIFERKAVVMKQGSLTLYQTYLTPLDLFADVNDDIEFTTVEELEPYEDGMGFQRILVEARANRLAEHLERAMQVGYAHLPIPIFLATDKEVRYDDDTSLLTFNKKQVCPFNVVDGQHRLEGLRRAVIKHPELKAYQLPAVIAPNLGYTEQMLQFFVVNTTQVPIEKSLRQQITRRFSDKIGVVAELPYEAIPKSLSRRIELGRDAKATHTTEYLNINPQSPLYQMVQMANESATSVPGKIKEGALTNVLLQNLFNDANNPLAVGISDFRKARDIILNYFIAVDNVFVNGRDRTKTTIYKSGGLRFVVGASKWVLGALNNFYPKEKRYLTASMEDVLIRALAELDDNDAHIADPDWYMPERGNREKANYQLTSVQARYYSNTALNKAIIRAMDTMNAD